jgi:signal transduction histidine kinase
MVVDEFRSLCSEKQIQIHFHHPEEGIEARLDPDRIKQVIRNLLSNAVKFSPPGGNIHARVRRIAEAALLSVRDEGPGIPADELEIVFDKFVQSSKTKSGSGGTGLGLAICREIVAEHEGRIWAESHENSGCIFYVQLPLLQAAEEEDSEPKDEFDLECLDQLA